MLSLKERPRTNRPEEGQGGGKGRWQWIVFLLLAGFLLFAHGCHGDEDNELFAWIRAACSWLGD
jgi:hypothetical protein